MRDEQEAPQGDYTETPAVEAEAPEAEREVEHTETPEAEAPPPKAWSAEDEQEARLFGWKPPDEWQGEKGPGYIGDPQEFLDRVSRSRIFQGMQEKMTEQQRKLDAVNKATQDRIRQEYEQRLHAITSRQRRAVEEADTQTWDQLERQRQEMLRQPPQVEPQAPPEEPRAIREFRETTDWAKDPLYWNEATQMVDVALQHGLVRPNDPEGQLAFVKERMQAKYPKLSPQPQSQPRQRVDGGGLATGPVSGRSAFDRLPQDVKTQFKKEVARGSLSDSKKDREWFAEVYNNG